MLYIINNQCSVCVLLLASARMIIPSRPSSARLSVNRKIVTATVVVVVVVVARLFPVRMLQYYYYVV